MTRTDNTEIAVNSHGGAFLTNHFRLSLMGWTYDAIVQPLVFIHDRGNNPL